MERFGRWAWERQRDRFVVLVTLAAVLTLTGGLALPAVVIGSIYLGLSIAEGALWLGVVTLLAIPMQAGLLWWERDARRHIRRWAEGDESDPEAAWSALLGFPTRVAARVFLVYLPGNVVTSLPLVLALADEPGTAGAAGLLWAYVIVVGAASALIATTLQLLLRPATEEVAPHVRSFDHRLTGLWTLRRRLVVATFVLSTLAVVAGPVLVLGTAADEHDYAIALFAGSLVAAYITWLLDLALFRATVAPVDDLLVGTSRIERGDLVTPVPVSSPDELGDLVIAFNSMREGLRERASLQEAFGSYVDPLLAQRLLESGSAVFAGEELEVTVVFADVRDFTSYAEGVSPSEAVRQLNRLFDVIVPVLHEHGGHANHYLGDGLLAVFGAPQPLVHHADAAVAAAIEVQRRVRAEFGDGLRIGIGIGTGPVIAGTVGGGGRHEFTVIGDTVNVAARVEQLTKDTGDPILITEATRVALSTPRPRSTRRGTFELRGKAAKQTIHAVNPFPRSTRQPRRSPTAS